MGKNLDLEIWALRLDGGCGSLAPNAHQLGAIHLLMTPSSQHRAHLVASSPRSNWQASMNPPHTHPAAAPGRESACEAAPPSAPENGSQKNEPGLAALNRRSHRHPAVPAALGCTQARCVVPRSSRPVASRPDHVSMQVRSHARQVGPPPPCSNAPPPPL
eukprot:CAMPEP_0183359036 /NCGR_PEP_ID=MMETSP0164_2-20130417/51041_1 /TAXON_ID=221442 /ORGANISM="Coccolithus pelagicus ssp braarudi, Strain PLY182g" /LENGTH=159 /DNA_ID=CAMNT_0025533059 /DNA_START=352 /DNA_END=830 /DNA_ORIENTATION=+